MKSLFVLTTCNFYVVNSTFVLDALLKNHLKIIHSTVAITTYLWGNRSDTQPKEYILSHLAVP